jgi:hypothetical protein
LPEDWKEIVINMYDQGVSDREIMRELKMSFGTWSQLYKDTTASNFAEIIDFGRMIARAWWEKTGRENLLTKGFNSNLYSLQMQNRFGWAQKSEQSNTNIELDSLDDVEIDSKIRQYMKKFEHVKG